MNKVTRFFLLFGKGHSPPQSLREVRRQRREIKQFISISRSPINSVIKQKLARMALPVPARPTFLPNRHARTKPDAKSPRDHLAGIFGNREPDTTSRLKSPP